MRLMNLHTGVTRFLGLSELLGARVVHFSRLPDQPDRLGFNKRNLPRPAVRVAGAYVAWDDGAEYADNRKRFCASETRCKHPAAGSQVPPARTRSIANCIVTGFAPTRSIYLRSYNA
jgi:hypothetical protein